MFSVIYVLGTQFALYNVITTFGIPFYHINLKFGLGFTYDLVADFILISVYIGMSNEFFFAIPKKKVMITYSVPRGLRYRTQHTWENNLINSTTLIFHSNDMKCN